MIRRALTRTAVVVAFAIGWSWGNPSIVQASLCPDAALRQTASVVHVTLLDLTFTTTAPNTFGATATPLHPLAAEAFLASPWAAASL